MAVTKTAKRGTDSARATTTGDIGPGVGAERARPGSERQVVEHVSHEPCSIEFSRDAKGVARWAIKAYSETSGLEKTIAEVLRLDSLLRSKTDELPAAKKSAEEDDDG